MVIKFLIMVRLIKSLKVSLACHRMCAKDLGLLLEGYGNQYNNHQSYQTCHNLRRLRLGEPLRKR